MKRDGPYCLHRLRLKLQSLPNQRGLQLILKAVYSHSPPFLSSVAVYLLYLAKVLTSLFSNQCKGCTCVYVGCIERVPAYIGPCISIFIDFFGHTPQQSHSLQTVEDISLNIL